MGAEPGRRSLKMPAEKLGPVIVAHQTLFQHQLGYVWPTIQHEKLFTQNVTNITFIFETSPNTKPKEKKVGRTWHFMSPRLKKWGDTSPVSRTKLRP